MVAVDLEAKKVVEIISTPRKPLLPDMPKWSESLTEGGIRKWVE